MDKMRRGSMDLTIKALFAIFIVLFVLFLGYSVLGSRQSSLEQEAVFSGEREQQALFLDLLGSSCLSVVDYRNKSIQVETQGLLSQRKLDRLANGNEDLHCVENFQVIYSIKVIDEVNQKEWLVGLNPSTRYGQSRTFSIPATILYDLVNVTPPQINIGRALLTRYSGPFPSAYGKIKEACRTQSSGSMQINLPYPISYRNDSGYIAYGPEGFYTHFGCEVQDFNVSRGRHLLYASYRNGKVIVT